VATLRFGKHEEVRCMVDIDARGPQGDHLCLAFKTSSYWVGAGVFLTDDGYVLKSLGPEKVYYRIGADGIAVAGLPDPLPAYSVPWEDYLGGYSLWLAIAFGMVWTAGARKLKARRRTQFDVTVGATPVTYGPPVLKTKGDHFVAATTAPLLRDGETVQHQAYTLFWDYAEERPSIDRAFYVVLTTQRLLLYSARVGAFGILLENQGVESYERNEIVNAIVDDGVLMLTFDDRTGRGFHVKKASAMSNQHAFLTNAARILTEGRGGP
jgi:hypothetical protein